MDPRVTTWYSHLIGPVPRLDKLAAMTDGAEELASELIGVAREAVKERSIAQLGAVLSL